MRILKCIALQGEQVSSRAIAQPFVTPPAALLSFCLFRSQRAAVTTNHTFVHCLYFRYPVLAGLGLVLEKALEDLIPGGLADAAQASDLSAGSLRGAPSYQPIE